MSPPSSGAVRVLAVFPTAEDRNVLALLFRDFGWQMRFVDSSGLGSFLSCLRKVLAGGGGLKLCGMSRQVRAIFELVKLHQILEIHDTSDEAVRAFQSGGTERRAQSV